MTQSEQLRTVLMLVEDLLTEVDLDNPVVMSDEGEYVMLPQSIIHVLTQLNEVLCGDEG